MGMDVGGESDYVRCFVFAQAGVVAVVAVAAVVVMMAVDGEDQTETDGM